ncbi:FAD-binding and (Fe-S)-binding domain-containing protein [Thiomicrorhabdus sp.]|uniref:FAD-binding and (Fe-S)-binding domain-containing protein n=1 Tax=Thiomicrorhabdus sp. TaxID=2039724 RepID=UPI0029C6821D|nr:FAD-binding and (Fe-S)-binding domain-containing protein [Thiomicrorhabdus sp.]
MTSSKRRFFTDASVFEIEASQVFCPVSQSDLEHCVRDSIRKALPITMRAGGTSLGGQAIGSGAVIDVSKCLTRIVDYRPEEQEVDVEPGVIQDDLNAFVRKDGLRFAPDTSTSNRAMIGGMIGNNSCGSYSVYYGTTREHVKSLDVILADGSQTTFEPLTPQMLREKLDLQSFEGNIYRTILNLLERHGKTILEHYPHPSIKRRNTGYALDELYRHHQPFNPDGRPFNLAPLICGSEGTLAVIKKATLHLVKTPKFQQLICAHFDSVEQAMKIVDRLLAFNPAAIELIDKATLDGAKANLQQQQNRFWIDGDPQAVLVIELFDEDENVLIKRLNEQQQWLLQHGAYSAPMVDRADSAKVWEVRKAGLGMLMGKVTRKKAVAVIEDAAVPVTALYDYYQDVRNLMAELGEGCVYYGHASVGLIHIRPELDLATPEGRNLFQTIAERNSKLVKKYRGALSGEHGDGRIRAPFLREQIGDQVYAWLLELKRAFDPHNLLNPGVILGSMPITQNLRADRQPQQHLPTVFDWSRDLSLMDAVEKCNGAGACRKSSGLMCPSYQATREENYSTRGRANLLRRALSEPDPRQALSHPELQEALELCLGCKGCKSQCPANVDMARLKAEVLFHSRRAFDLSRVALKYYGRLLKVGSRMPRVFNGLQSLGSVKWLMGVDSRRTLPQVQKADLSSWWQESSVQSFGRSEKTKVWVLCDLFSQYQEPQVGRAVLNSLQKLDMEVHPVFMQQSPRALISKGLLLEARDALLHVAELLLEWQDGDFLIGIEPSELLVWRDEAQDLLAKLPYSPVFENMQRWRSQVQSFEEFVLARIELGEMPALRTKPKKVWLHVHCHQKSLARPGDSQKALQWIDGLQVEMIPSGCCGMSGEFGYKHYEVSKTIAEQTLLPVLSKARDEDWIVATGTSCRHQIADLGGYQALHIAQIFERIFDAAD